MRDALFVHTPIQRGGVRGGREGREKGQGAEGGEPEHDDTNIAKEGSFLKAKTAAGLGSRFDLLSQTVD
jgi:hypothetical protein